MAGVDLMIFAIALVNLVIIFIELEIKKLKGEGEIIKFSLPMRIFFTITVIIMIIYIIANILSWLPADYNSEKNINQAGLI